MLKINGLMTSCHRNALRCGDAWVIKYGYADLILGKILLKLKGCGSRGRSSNNERKRAVAAASGHVSRTQRPNTSWLHRPLLHTRQKP